MSYRSLISWVALLIYTASAAAVEPVFDAKSDEVIRRFANFYKGVKSFSVSGDCTLDGNNHSKVRVVCVKPNKLAIDIVTDESNEVGYRFNGEVPVAYFSRENVYTEFEPESFGSFVGFSFLKVDSLLSEDTNKSILKNARTVKWLAEEEIEGVACDHIFIFLGGGGFHAWIAKGERPLLMRVNGSLEAPNQELRLKDWVFDPEVEETTFTFDPPPHPANKIKDHPVLAMEVPEPPIECKPEATLEADFIRKHHEWASRQLIAPFKERTKNASWAELALAFVEAAVDDLADPILWRKYDDALFRGQELLAAGCDDPLVVYLYYRLNYRQTEDRKNTDPIYLHLLQTLEPDRSMNRAFLNFIARDYLEICSGDSPYLASTSATLVKLIAEAVETGCYSAKGDDEVFIHHQVDEQWSREMTRRPDLFMELYENLKLSEWAKLTLLGKIEITLAWKDRGYGWASSVTAEGWAGFHDHLAKASKHLSKAWRLNPKSPYAPTFMIPVAMGDREVAGADCRTWFDRAIAARFDHFSAYQHLMTAYLPRWGGSDSRLFGFGKACLATGRFDTLVPIIFKEICHTISRESKEGKTFYRRSEVSAPLLELYTKMRDEPSREAEKNGRTQNLAAMAWLCGKFELAATVLPNAEGSFHTGAIGILQIAGETEESFRMEVARLNNPQTFENAEANYMIGNFAEALPQFEAILEKAPPTLLPLVHARIAAIKFESQFVTGEWVTLPVTPGLPQWRIRDGDWSADDKGNLINKGTDKNGLILFVGKVGPNFEMTGDFEVNAPGNCCRRMGVAMGWNGNGREQWVTCLMDQKSGVSLLDRHWNHDETKFPAPILKEGKNHFCVRTERGKVTCQINEQVIMDSYKPASLSLGQPGALAGFSACSLCAKNTTTLSNLKIRKLK